MKFYIDFEAAQFSDRIISIGCVAADGKEFYTLAKPKESKMTKFTVALTGITTEALATAPTIEEAFVSFSAFINEYQSHNEFLVFGDGDSHFISASMREINNMDTLGFMGNLKRLLVDCSKTVQSKLGVSGGLNKLYRAFYNTNNQQTHNALDDARMLKNIMEWLENATAEEKAEAIERINYINTAGDENDGDSIVAQLRADFIKMKKAPSLFVSWDKYKMDAAPTEATEYDYVFKCDGSEVIPTKYFKDLRIAALWLCKYRTHTSPKKEEHIVKLMKHIKESIKCHTSYYGSLWSNK